MAAPLSTAQLEALRKLELWAQSDAADAPDEASADLLYTATAEEGGGMRVHAHPAVDAPAGAMAPVRNAYDLEAFALRADREQRRARRGADRHHLVRLRSQVACCRQLEGQADRLLETLGREASRCAEVNKANAGMIVECEATIARRNDEAALAEALAEQLRPLQRAKAVGASLDVPTFGEAPERLMLALPWPARTLYWALQKERQA